jgi:hypothetical protein
MQTPSAGQRTDPPFINDERASLDAWLDYHRATLLWKCDGPNAEQLAQRSVPPSTMSLLGLVRHLTEVERSWFRRFVGGQDVPLIYCSDEAPDGDFDDVDAGRAELDLAAFRDEIVACRAAVAGLDLEHRSHSERRGYDIDLRWVYTHMIEEYARHNSHADLLRECIDGLIGE